ncbi:MAG TPA: winged helix DNA-binding domain-containing protein, partial [Saprospiraceae bacterium]|nr:winged helix DNA-binding domain-containing protein [Saprospiraceae bacterium]
QLTSPRVQAFNKLYYKQQELDEKIFKKSNDLLIRSLRDHIYLTKAELKVIFEKAKIKTDDLRLTYIIINAELEGIICSGPRKGKQFTYALIDEKAPAVKPFIKEEALNKLGTRFFKTRGPATIKDFTWWSSLTIKEANEGIATLDSKFIRENIDGKEYIFYDGSMPDSKKTQSTFLMPDYDEYGISYKDRSIYHNPKAAGEVIEMRADYFHAIIADGYFAGTWDRKVIKDQPVVTVKLLKSLYKRQLEEIERERSRYLKFFEYSS